ncbi:MAG: hypothetical protein R3F11_13070 [Verrucomicrobiales bacterium]
MPPIQANTTWSVPAALIFASSGVGDRWAVAVKIFVDQLLQRLCWAAFSLANPMPSPPSGFHLPVRLRQNIHGRVARQDRRRLLSVIERFDQPSRPRSSSSPNTRKMSPSPVFASPGFAPRTTGSPRCIRLSPR